ncbi:MAG: molecular chaperone [Devosia sp.]|nr:molecular chaperone [Devosia sp.]
MHRASAAAALVLMFGSATSAEASSLRVAPITLKLSARAAGMLQVWNDGRAAVQVQVRVFRWTVVNGRDVLQLTQDVIASPPMTTLLPGGGNVIRVVRVANVRSASRKAIACSSTNSPIGQANAREPSMS